MMMEFRAGKMIADGKRVVPDTRRGLVRIARGEEGLVHFQWLDRIQNVVEHDEIIFPNEAVFEKVNQSSERVYILKFNTDDRKYFFWLQEPKADGDSQLCESVNYHINRPLEFVDEPEDDALASLPIPEDIMDEDILSRAGNMIGSNIGAQANSNVSSSSGPVKFEDLQRILSNIGPEEAVDDPDGGLELGDIFRSDLIQPLIHTLPVEERLASYLPEGHWNAEEFVELLQSPPFRQQVDAFTYVLRTGQIDLTQFGIDPSKYKFTVTSFLEALEDSVSVASQAEDDKSPISQIGNTKDSMDESH